MQFHFLFIFYWEQHTFLGQALSRCILKVSVYMALVCVNVHAISNVTRRINAKIRSQTMLEIGKGMIDKCLKDEGGTAWLHFGLFSLTVDDSANDSLDRTTTNI